MTPQRCLGYDNPTADSVRAWSTAASARWCTPDRVRYGRRALGMGARVRGARAAFAWRKCLTNHLRCREPAGWRDGARSRLVRVLVWLGSRSLAWRDGGETAALSELLPLRDLWLQARGSKLVSKAPSGRRPASGCAATRTQHPEAVEFARSLVRLQSGIIRIAGVVHQGGLSLRSPWPPLDDDEGAGAVVASSGRQPENRARATSASCRVHRWPFSGVRLVNCRRWRGSRHRSVRGFKRATDTLRRHFPR